VFDPKWVEKCSPAGNLGFSLKRIYSSRLLLLLKSAEGIQIDNQARVLIRVFLNTHLVIGLVILLACDLRFTVKFTLVLHHVRNWNEGLGNETQGKRNAYPYERISGSFWEVRIAK